MVLSIIIIIILKLFHSVANISVSVDLRNHGNIFENTSLKVLKFDTESKTNYFTVLSYNNNRKITKPKRNLFLEMTAKMDVWPLCMYNSDRDRERKGIGQGGPWYWTQDLLNKKPTLYQLNYSRPAAENGLLALFYMFSPLLFLQYIFCMCS